MLICAELASDGGIPPDVKYTAIVRRIDGIEDSLESSVCKQTWSPMWPKARRLECILSKSEHKELEYIFWDQSTTLPACLGECVLKTDDLETVALSSARSTTESTIHKYFIVQETDETSKIVGSIVVDVKLHPPNQRSPANLKSELNSQETTALKCTAEFNYSAQVLNTFFPRERSFQGIEYSRRENSSTCRHLQSPTDCSTHCPSHSLADDRNGHESVKHYQDQDLAPKTISQNSLSELVPLIVPKSPWTAITSGVKVLEETVKNNTSPVFIHGSQSACDIPESETTSRKRSTTLEFGAVPWNKRSTDFGHSKELSGLPVLSQSFDIGTFSGCKKDSAKLSHMETEYCRPLQLPPSQRDEDPDAMQGDREGILRGSDSEPGFERTRSEDEAYAKTALERPELQVPVIERPRSWRMLYFRIAALMLCVISVTIILGAWNASKPWHISAWAGVTLVGLSPWSSDPNHFFGVPELFLDCHGPVLLRFSVSRQPIRDQSIPSPAWLPVWVVLSSFVAATFGYALHASAVMGRNYGIAGGLGYAVWYFGICVMGCAVCLIRRRFPTAQSMITCINSCFGSTAAALYGTLCIYRLWNIMCLSVFSAGTLFVPYDGVSGQFWGGLLSGLGPCIYCLSGGTNAIFVSESLQSIVMIVLLIVIIVALPFNRTCWFCESSNGEWSETEGLIFYRFLQGCFSLPWVTSVLLDRLFIGRTIPTFLSFLLGIGIAFGYSFIGSFVGIYGKVYGALDVPVSTVQTLGDTYGSMVLLLTVLSVMAAADSSMISAANLGGVELFSKLFPTRPYLVDTMQYKERKKQMIAAKLSILVLCIATVCFSASSNGTSGSLPSSLLSSVMTMGLGPPCYLLIVWKTSWKQSPLSFILPVATSLIIGIIQDATADCLEANFDMCLVYSNSSLVDWRIGSGQHSDQLGKTIFTLLFSILACWIGFAFDQQFR